MGFEIEKKFLVKENQLPFDASKGIAIKQGYLHGDEKKVIRVRIKGTKGYITIKSKVSGATNLEFEYEIPTSEAEELLTLFCHKIITKRRVLFPQGQFTWEIDFFEGDNEGLIFAEIELQNEDDYFTLPDWITEEVTDDIRYYNAYLAKNPFKDWKNE